MEDMVDDSTPLLREAAKKNIFLKVYYIIHENEQQNISEKRVGK